MTDLTVEDYSEKCIVVRGNTQSHSVQLKALGGKFAPYLRNGGPGWIFPKRGEDDVLAYVSSGVSPNPEDKGDVIDQIEELFARMTTKERLRFISRVTLLAINKNEPEPKPRGKFKPKSFAKKKNKNDDEVVIVSDDDEDEQPRKRLLG
uniref:Uncharacterized protein n=1 Tax=viral metagenome TaxID=1070528 RepID=A0A6C0ELS3_9ZZZZ